MPRKPTRDTGFPEPFCSRTLPKNTVLLLTSWLTLHRSERNTTLPHPEADLSPNACIGSKEVSNGLDIKRAHRSFMHRRPKHKKILSQGVITPSLPSTTSEVSLQPTTTQSTTQQLASPSLLSVVETNHSTRQSRDGRDSFVSKRDAETPPTSPEEVASIKSTKSVLRRWRRK
jgi:hypothetical protein